MTEPVSAYSICGLNIHASQPLPGLEPLRNPSALPDLQFHLGCAPESEKAAPADREDPIYVSPYLVEAGEPSLRVWKIADGAFLRFDYFDGTRFWLDRDYRNVWARWPERFTLEDTAPYILGPVLGTVLRLRGTASIHASAVVIEDRAVLFAGPPGAGKSTTAAALALRGHAVISDDIVALDERGEQFYARPAYPYVSLWPSSVLALYGADKILPAISNDYDKRMLSLPAEALRFADGPAPLGAIFLLGERSADDTAPFLEELPRRDSVISLVANGYPLCANFLLSEEARAREFSFLGRLVAGVRVWRLRSHRDASRIGSFCDMIESALRQPKDRAVPVTQSE